MEVASGEHPHTHSCDEVGAPVEGAAHSNTRLGMARPIAIKLTAMRGALLGALVALMQGSATLAGFALTMAHAGYFKNWVIVAAYAGRSLLGLLLIVLATASMGALAWIVGALVWNRAATVHRLGREPANN